MGQRASCSRKCFLKKIQKQLVGPTRPPRLQHKSNGFLARDTWRRNQHWDLFSITAASFSRGLAPITQWTAAASCLHGRVLRLWGSGSAAEAKAGYSRQHYTTQSYEQLERGKQSCVLLEMFSLGSKNQTAKVQKQNKKNLKNPNKSFLVSTVLADIICFYQILKLLGRSFFSFLISSVSRLSL